MVPGIMLPFTSNGAICCVLVYAQVLMLGSHAWMLRDWLQAALRLPRLADVFSGAGVPWLKMHLSRVCRSGVFGIMFAEEDPKTQQKIDEARVALFGLSMKLGGAALAMVAFFHVSSFQAWAQAGEATDAGAPALTHSQMIVIACTVYYGICLAFIASQSRFTANAVFRWFQGAMALEIIRVALVRDSLYFFVYGTNRLVMRLFLSGPVLDTRRVLLMNGAYSMVSCFAFFRNYHVLDQGASGSGHNFVGFLVSELCAFLILLVTVSLLESTALGHAQVSLESRSLDQVRRAALKLLAVLCDAQVHVNSEYEVLGHSPALLSLLALNQANGSKTLEGTSLLPYVPEEERERFFRFMSLSTADADQASNAAEDLLTEPAASIQMTLKNRMDTAMAVELFCVYLPDSKDRPGRLIGIRQATGSAPEETAMDAPGIVGLSMVEDEPAEEVEEREEKITPPPSNSEQLAAISPQLRIGSLGGRPRASKAPSVTSSSYLGPQSLDGDLEAAFLPRKTAKTAKTAESHISLRSAPARAFPVSMAGFLKDAAAYRNGDQADGPRGCEGSCVMDCFPVNATVWVEGEAAPKQVSDLEEGMRVLCYDALGGSLKFAEVTSVSVDSNATEWVNVRLAEGTELTLTSDHPVQPVQKSGLGGQDKHLSSRAIKAGDLTPGRDSVMVHRVVTMPVSVSSVTKSSAEDLGMLGRASVSVRQAERHSILVAAPGGGGEVTSVAVGSLENGRAPEPCVHFVNKTFLDVLLELDVRPPSRPASAPPPDWRPLETEGSLDGVDDRLAPAVKAAFADLSTCTGATTSSSPHSTPASVSEANLTEQGVSHSSMSEDGEDPVRDPQISTDSTDLEPFDSIGPAQEGGSLFADERVSPDTTHTQDAADDLTDMQAYLDTVGTEQGCPSVGSRSHAIGDCRPCHMHHRGRCHMGVECTFCHMQHVKKKVRGKSKYYVGR